MMKIGGEYCILKAEVLFKMDPLRASIRVRLLVDRETGGHTHGSDAIR